ncbi:hypothetical protein EXIGLDRAFT_782679, partial [Exidia glandulosa HHB12029]
NKAVVNEDPNARLIRELKEELDLLRARVSGASSEEVYDPKVPPSMQKVAIPQKDGTIKTELNETCRWIARIDYFDDGGSSSPCATFLTFVDLVESINELDISLVMQFGARVRDRQSWTYASSIVYPNDVVSFDVPFARAMHAPLTRHPMHGSTLS